MKALTICQPWAWAILNANKRVEYRGPLLIHAGKSRSWMQPQVLRQLEPFGIRVHELQFGAIVGVCSLVAVVAQPAGHQLDAMDNIDLGDPRFIEGPWCWVLSDVRELANPIPWRGEQGLFEVEDNFVPPEVRR